MIKQKLLPPLTSVNQIVQGNVQQIEVKKEMEERETETETAH